MTKKREKGEVMITKKIARACKRPVINHLVRGDDIIVNGSL